MTNSNNNQSTGIQKVAKLVSILGVELMLPLLTRLPRETVEQINVAVKNRGNMVKGEAVALLREFNQMGKILVGSSNSLDSLLEDYDEAKLAQSPAEIQRRLLVGFAKLGEQTPDKIYEIIKGECALYKVIILKQLPEKVGQEVFLLMPKGEQVSFAIEAKKSVDINKKVLMTLSNMIEDKLEHMMSKKKTNFDTVLNFSSGLDEEQLESFLCELPQEIADEIRANAITFGDIVAQDKKVLSKILGAIDATTLAAACCKSSEGVISIIKGSITSTKGQDLDYNLGEVDKDDKNVIRNAQQQIVLRAKELKNRGEIELVK